MLEQEAKPAAEAAGESLEDVDLTIEEAPATAGSDEDFMLDLETLLDDGHGPVSAGKPDEASEALDLDVVPAEVRGSSTDLEIEFEPEVNVPPVKRLPVAAAAQASSGCGCGHRRFLHRRVYQRWCDQCPGTRARRRTRRQEEARGG